VNGNSPWDCAVRRALWPVQQTIWPPHRACPERPGHDRASIMSRDRERAPVRRLGRTGARTARERRDEECPASHPSITRSSRAAPQREPDPGDAYRQKTIERERRAARSRERGRDQWEIGAGREHRGFRGGPVDVD